MVEKKLNIAMLGHKHVLSREGGIEIVVNELATRMAARGHQVTCYDRNHYPNIKFSYHRLKLKNPKYIRHLYHDFSDMDYVFDITFGDGFSDI